jgi:hypothetical protein
LSGDGGVYTLTDVLPVTAGGFYSVSLLDVLSERGIATLKSSFEGNGSEQGALAHPVAFPLPCRTDRVAPEGRV